MVGNAVGGESLGVNPAITHLKDCIANGSDLLTALIESMALWTLPEETHRDKHHRYLLDGEAFDLLLLAERLLTEVDQSIPDPEKLNLFSNGIPSPLTQDEFKDLIGPEKYSAYLNYWYGIVVEEAIIRSAVDEEQKRLHSNGVPSDSQIAKSAFLKVYGVDRDKLHEQFRLDKGYSESLTFSATEAKEFMYWLFKYRLVHSVSEKVASDTRKGIQYLQRMRSMRRDW